MPDYMRGNLGPAPKFSEEDLFAAKKKAARR
jgi:hypothetical protein